MPQGAIDPTLAAAGFIQALHTIVSRELSPTDIAAVSLGKLNAGDAFNIIPAKVELLGSTRSFDSAVRVKLQESIRRMADGVAAAYRCKAETTVTEIFAPLVNDREATEILRDAAVELVGSEQVEESPFVMVSEDYCYYLEKVPGTYFFLGVGNADKGADSPHHSPRFDIDEDALPTGAALLANYALKMMVSLKK